MKGGVTELPSVHGRFTPDEQARLAAISASIDWTQAQADRADELHWEELTADPYELELADAYRSQVHALHRHFRKLCDLLLEKRMEEIAQVGRQIQDGSRYSARSLRRDGGGRASALLPDVRNGLNFARGSLRNRRDDQNRSTPAGHDPDALQRR